MCSKDEFSVPVDQEEVDAILSAAEAGGAIPLFIHGDETKTNTPPSHFTQKKEEGNALFKAGEYVKAIMAYDAALRTGPPSDSDAAVVHANAAQALLNLSAADALRREACAAEAFRRAIMAAELDPTNVKAHLRCAASCEILGEHAAASEAKAKADACSAVRAATEALAMAAKTAEAEEKRKALEAQKAAFELAMQKKAAKEALLQRERAFEREKIDRQIAKESSDAGSRLSAMLRFDADLGGIGVGLGAAPGNKVF